MSKNPDYVLNYLTAELPSLDKAPDWWKEENAFYKEERKIQVKSEIVKYEKRQRLTFIRRLTKGNNSKGLYQCECGNLHEARITSVNAGRTKSCGCSQTRSKEWKNMINREKCRRYRQRKKLLLCSTQ